RSVAEAVIARDCHDTQAAEAGADIAGLTADEPTRQNIERSIAKLPDDDVAKIVPPRTLAGNRNRTGAACVMTHIAARIRHDPAIENVECPRTFEADIEELRVDPGGGIAC